MDDPSALLAIEAGIQRCASVAADCMVERDPALNAAKIREALATELWMAVGEVADLSRSGAVLV